MTTKPKRVMPVKTAPLDFTEDGYPGFTAQMRTNAPFSLVRKTYETKDEEEAREGYLKLFPGWDFVDDDGKPIPHTVEGFDEIPADLLRVMLHRRVEAVKEAVMPGPLGDSSSKAPSSTEPGP